MPEKYPPEGAERAGVAAPDAERIAEARRAFETLRARRAERVAPSARERIEALRRLRTSVTARRGELAGAVHADFRKHPTETELTEIQPVLAEVRHVIRHVRSWMRPRRVPSPLLLSGSRSEIRYEPRGVVLVLGPWNYPVNLMLSPLVAAVAAGNSVVLRPSEKAPHTAGVLERIVAESFPRDEVAVAGGGVEVAEALLRLPFDHFFFTGSTEVGRKVMRAAADHLATVTLELGGKSPALVDASADVAASAERIAWGKFVNAGQTCVAPDYVLVDRARAGELVEELMRAVGRLYGGTEEARRRSGSFCRLVDDRAFERVAGMLEGSVAAGARVEVGGTTDAAERYVAPTVLSGVTWEMTAMAEEIFGPVLPVIAYDSLDDALRRIRERPAPLALYVFARDPGVVERVLGRTTAGGTVVNDTLVHLANPGLPFGGVGESGQGSYHGWFGFRAFSHERAVLVRGRFAPGRALYPPYSERVSRLVEWLGRWMG